LVPGTLVFFSALLVTASDFVQLQGMNYTLGTTNLLGLALFFVGLSVRFVGKRTPGRYHSYGLRTLPDNRLVKHGIYRYIRHSISLAVVIYDSGIPLVFSSLYVFFSRLCPSPSLCAE
jgi:protein-S-isoprenylcysteine O-methyltransferase Ste14